MKIFTLTLTVNIITSVSAYCMSISPVPQDKKSCFLAVIQQRPGSGMETRSARNWEMVREKRNALLLTTLVLGTKVSGPSFLSLI